MIHPTVYEADEIAQALVLINDQGEAWPGQEWTVFDELGRQYVVDLLATGQAFLVTVEPHPNAQDEEP